ncbi:MAG: fused MFS/spermidine synthase [Phycisphaerae bacterium]|nr:fused MFS/spermidine synthase [Phycisphaerae bacterium]
MGNSHRVGACLLFFLSGCTGLIYELVWTRQLLLVLGSTTYAITTVIVAFMAGLALGSHIAGRRCDGLARPGQAYALLEITIGLYGFLVPLLLRAAHPLYATLHPYLTDTPWILTAARFFVSSTVLVIPTTCMGATLPILVRCLTTQTDVLGQTTGRLYGINTMGAVAGTLFAGFWLIPTLGLMHTTHATATVNLAIGFAAMILFRGTRSRPAASPDTTDTPSAGQDTTSDTMTVSLSTYRGVLCSLALSGFAAMVYQVSWTRELIVAIGSSTYAFTCVLAAFILGLAAGSLAIAHTADRWRNPVLVLGWIELGIALAAILMTPLHSRLPRVARWAIERFPENFDALLWTQLTLVVAVILVPTCLMGAVFPLATKIIASKDRRPGAAVGRAYMVNTCGSIAGALAAGFFMIRSDVLGVRHSIAAAAMANTAIGIALITLASPAGKRLTWRLALPMTTAMIISLAGTLIGRSSPRALIDRAHRSSNPGAVARGHADEELECLYFAEGVDTTVAVIRTANGTPHYALTINGRTEASTGDVDMPTQLLCGHVPALLCPDGKAACVIGLASGITLGAVSRYDSFETLDCIEISEEVICAAEFFAPYAHNVLDDGRLSVICEDARNYLALTNRTYNLIVSQPSNLWVSGVSSLFTQEFFALARQRLSDRGVLCIWLQAYGMSLRDFRTVVHTLCNSMEFVSAWQATTGDVLLIAGRQPFSIPLDSLSRRFSAPAVRKDLYRIGVSSLATLLGRFVASGEPLRAWAAAAPIHTDDNAMLEFSTPRSRHRPKPSPILNELHRIGHSPFDEIVVASSADPQHERLRRNATRSREGVKLWIKGLNAAVSQDPDTAIRLLLEAYRLDPRNYLLHHDVMELRRVLVAHVPLDRPRPERDAILDEIDRLRMPTITRLTGNSELTDLASELYAQAHDAWRQGMWDAAADYLAEAHDLDPDREAIVVRLAWANLQLNRLDDAACDLDRFLERHPAAGAAHHMRAAVAAQAGAVETAFVHIQAALRAGISPDRLHADPLLTPLGNDPRFRQLLAPHVHAPPQ